MLTLQQPEVHSHKFLIINTLEHRFPEELKGLGIPVTLLHYHSHCPPNYVLVYQDNFMKSEYLSREQAEAKYFPCSWYLEDGEIISY
jgi:hypothetical protein